jgi:hypothetical protein
VRGSWGKWGHLECGVKWRAWSARQGRRWAVGIRQQRRLEWARHNTKAPSCAEYVSSRALCAIICYDLDNCDCEPCLNMSICFRRINHMALENHLHSSSGIRQVVSGTVCTSSITRQYMGHGGRLPANCCLTVYYLPAYSP